VLRTHAAGPDLVTNATFAHMLKAVTVLPHSLCVSLDLGLARAIQGLELAVPGTYIAGEPVVTIAAFAPQLHVITSKQRPRKLTIHGSDGAEYVFLLKVGSSVHWAGL